MPQPPKVFNPKDQNLSCDEIKAECETLQKNLDICVNKIQKTHNNKALGPIDGLLAVPPSHLRSTSERDEKATTEAFRARYNRLTNIYNLKRCGPHQHPIKPLFVKD